MRRVLSALALVLLALAVPATPAAAKGPTHLLLLTPGSGESVVIDFEDPRMAEVERLLGDVGDRVAGREHERWDEVDVAWMMQGIDVFRSDIVFVDGKGSAVVMSGIVQKFRPEGGRRSLEWRWVRDGEALTALFTDLGLLGGVDGALAKPGSKGASPKETAPAAPVTIAGTDADPSSGGGRFDGWPWALPGALVGLVVGLLGAAGLARRMPQAVAQRFARS